MKHESRHESEKEAAIEREQVERVLRLTGGELDDKPWHYWLAHRYSDGTAMDTGDIDSFYEGRSHYWYEGAPDGSEIEDSASRNLRTLIAFGGGYMSAPNPELYDGDGIWKLVHSWNHSGETECPGQQYNRDGTKTVTEETSTDGECHLCEEKIGEDHRFIYIGEGYEATYELVEQAPGQRAIEEILDDEFGHSLEADGKRLEILLMTVNIAHKYQHVGAMTQSLTTHYTATRNALWQLILLRRMQEETNG
jgi:hypothetical protein